MFRCDMPVVAHERIDGHAEQRGQPAQHHCVDVGNLGDNISGVKALDLSAGERGGVLPLETGSQWLL